MAAPSPSDFPPDLLNDYCGGQLLGTSIAFMILGPMFVALRFYTRVSTKARLGWDDYLIMPALVANISLQAADIALVTDGGVGYHVERWVVYDPMKIFDWAKVLFVVELTYLLSVCMGKLTILAIYARIFTSKGMLYTTYTLAGVVIASWFGSSIACILQYLPVGCQWDPNATGYCRSFDILAFFRYLSLPNIITDVFMLVLPMPMIWQLKLSRSQKFGLTGVFLTGSIGIIASCVRFAEFFQSDALEDPTWKSSFLNVWTVTEPATYLIAACLPALRPIFLSAMRRLNLTRITKVPRAGGYDYTPHGDNYPKARYGGGSKLSNLDSRGRLQRSGAAEPSVLESGKGRFERLTEDEASVASGDERKLIPGDGEVRNAQNGRQDPHSGIQVRKDINIVFSDRDVEPSPFELQSSEHAR